MKERDRAFFQPMWRRVAVTLFAGAWTAWEWLIMNDSFFGIITAAIAGYCVWAFFINWKDVEPAPEPKNDEPA